LSIFARRFGNAFYIRPAASGAEACINFSSLGLKYGIAEISAIGNILIYGCEISEGWLRLDFDPLEEDLHAVGNINNGRFVTDRISEGSKNALHPFVPGIEKYFDASESF
jgi:hypothetical protein